MHDLKQFVGKVKDYSATPRLTSDYFESAVVQLYCNLGGKNKLCTPLIEPEQLRRIGIQSLCQAFRSEQAQLVPLTEKVNQSVAREKSLKLARSQLIHDFLKHKYPIETQLHSNYLIKREANIAEIQDGTKPPYITSEDEEKAWILLEQKGVDLAHPIEPLSSEVKEYYAFTKNASSPISMGEQIKKSFASASDESDAAQMDRKASIQKIDDTQKAFAEKFCKEFSDSDVCQRLQNILKCESLPLNAKAL